MTQKTAPQIRLSADALLALGRLAHLNLASNEAARSLRTDVRPGRHQGEVTVRLAYDIKVGEDSEAEVAASVPWQKLAAALFGRVNAATREAVVRDLLRPSGDGSFEFNDEHANPEAEATLKALMGKTRKTVAGKITGSAVLLPVED